MPSLSQLDAPITTSTPHTQHYAARGGGVGHASQRDPHALSLSQLDAGVAQGAHAYAAGYGSDGRAESVDYGRGAVHGYRGQAQGHVQRSGATVQRHSGQGQEHAGEHEDGVRGRGAVVSYSGLAQGQVQGSGAMVHWHSGQGQGNTS
jgi:hypothetical protein